MHPLTQKIFREKTLSAKKRALKFLIAKNFCHAKKFKKNSMRIYNMKKSGSKTENGGVEPRDPPNQSNRAIFVHVD
jgi:hypothetical protein